jgi:hypothetical protein
MNVEPTHDDYKTILETLKAFQEARGIVESTVFDLTTCEEALKVITAVSACSESLGTDSSAAYTIRKGALSQEGVTAEDLATFAALEIRLMKVEKFLRQTFSNVVLRERQDSRVRYEISDRSVKISGIFSSVEEHKRHLSLADYSVSQTSLEQVFNMHAAEAEQQKIGRIEHSMVMDCNTTYSTRSNKTIEGNFSSQATDNQLQSCLRLNREQDLPFDESSVHCSDDDLPFDEHNCIP